MNLQEVWREFCRMAELQGLEAKDALTLCARACEQLERKCRGVPQDGRDVARLSHAAAALAYYRYCRFGGLAEPSFKAGDISVGGSNDRERLARELWQEAKEGVSDLLEDEGFLFSRVEL